MGTAEVEDRADGTAAGTITGRMTDGMPECGFSRPSMLS